MYENRTDSIQSLILHLCSEKYGMYVVVQYADTVQ